MPRVSCRWKMIAGSISPERVPMTRPSSGVRPIEVSTHLPLRIAETEPPLPRWQVMMFSSSTGLFSIFAASWVTRSEEHTSELQSRFDLVCRLLLEKKKWQHELDKQPVGFRGRGAINLMAEADEALGSWMSRQ